MKQIQKLSQNDFLETFEKVPRLAANLIIENQRKEVLLTKRSIDPEKDKWHFPGSFLLKNETIQECLKRIAYDELNHDLVEEVSLLGVFENINKDSRGHVVDIVYKLKLSNSKSFIPTLETKEAKYFKVLPKEMGFNHRDTLIKIGYK